MDFSAGEFAGWWPENTKYSDELDILLAVKTKMKTEKQKSERKKWLLRRSFGNGIYNVENI